jgi:hypothetical protein
MDGERFYEVRARLGTLDEAVRVARTLDASGVAYVAVDSGEGYGLRECTAEGCPAILAYPDEGTACDEHRCAECGGVLPPNPALALVEGYACDTCYGGRWDK